MPDAQAERHLHLSRREEPAGDIEPGEPVRHVPDHARRSGDRRRGWHGRRSTYQFYQRISAAANRTLFTNDPHFRQSYKGLEITLHQALVEPLADAGRLHLRRTAVEGSASTPPELPDQRDGSRWPVRTPDVAAGRSADRPHQFKLTGMYVAAVARHRCRRQLQLSRAAPDHTSDQPCADGRRQQTINLEPLGLVSARTDGLTCVSASCSRFGDTQPRGVGRLRQPDQRQHGVGRAHAERHDNLVRTAIRTARQHCSSSCRRAQSRPRTSCFSAAFNSSRVVR